MDYTTGVFNGESIGTTTESGVGGIQNWNNLKGERSPSALDQMHRMIVNGVYELPFFRAQKGFAGPLWEAGRARRSARSTAAVRSASLPLRAARSPQGGGQRPNWAGVNPALETPVPARWFETYLDDPRVVLA